MGLILAAPFHQGKSAPHTYHSGVRLFSFHKLLPPFLLGAGILATFGREMAFALGYGTSKELEVFRLAFGPPNMMSQTLAPAFIGVMLPLLAHAAAHSPAAEFHLRRRILKLNLWGAILIAAIGVLLASPLATVIAPGFQGEAREQIADQLRILWIFFGITSLTFGFRTFLNFRDSFWPGASTSLAISSVFILVCVIARSRQWETTASTLSWAAVGGGVLVLCIHLLGRPLRKEDLVPAPADAHPDLPKTSLLLPLCGAALYQVSASIPRFLDRGFASSLPQGSVAALEYSYNVLTAPGILLGTSFVMLAYPRFVRGLAAGTPRLATREVARPLGLVLLAAAFISVMVFLFAEPLVELIYRRGAFDQQDVQMTSKVLRTQALGLAPMVAGMVLVQGILGLQLIRLLLMVSLVRIGLRWIVLHMLVPDHELAGIGTAYALTEATILIAWVGIFYWRLPRDRSSAH